MMIKTNGRKFSTVNLYAILLLFILFPIHRVGSTIPFSVLSILFIIDLFLSKKFFELFRKNTFLILCTIYFILCSFSYFKATNFESFLEKEKLKILFFAFPLYLYQAKDIIKLNWLLIIKTSVLCSFLAMVFFIIVAFNNYEELGINSFLYGQLVSVSFVNPIVYSIVLNINLILAFFYIENIFLKIVFIFCFASFILLLLSKMGIFILILNIISFLAIGFKTNRRNAVFMLFSSILLSIFFAPQFFNSELVQRRINVFKYYAKNNNSENLDKQFPRKTIFISAVNIIKSNPLFGVGISNTKKALHKEFEKNGFKKGIENKFDAHNQFLETFLGLGVLGFLSLLSIFVYLFYKAINNKNWVLLYLCIIFSIIFLVESYLESQMGLVSFVVYSSLLLIKDKSFKI